MLQDFVDICAFYYFYCYFLLFIFCHLIAILSSVGCGARSLINY